MQTEKLRHHMQVEKLAFEGSETPDRGFTIKAWYLEEPNKSEALIEIYREGKEIRHFLFPAYKIWNLAAHFSDIVDGELENSDSGYQIAAATGLEGLVKRD